MAFSASAPAPSLLRTHGVSSFTQQIIIGVVILVTVWIDQLRNRR